MFRKFRIAHNFLKKSYFEKLNESRELDKIRKKCFFSYITQCLLKKDNSFVIKYSGKTIPSLKKRFYYILRYLIEWVKFFVLFILFPSKSRKKLIKDISLKKLLPSKPISGKITNAPNEDKLYYILEKNGFCVNNEELGRVTTKYFVSPI